MAVNFGSDTSGTSTFNSDFSVNIDNNAEAKFEDPNTGKEDSVTSNTVSITVNPGVDLFNSNSWLDSKAGNGNGNGNGNVDGGGNPPPGVGVGSFGTPLELFNGPSWTDTGTNNTIASTLGTNTNTGTNSATNTQQPDPMFNMPLDGGIPIAVPLANGVAGPVFDPNATVQGSSPINVPTGLSAASANPDSVAPLGANGKGGTQDRLDLGLKSPVINVSDALQSADVTGAANAAANAAALASIRVRTDGTATNATPAQQVAEKLLANDPPTPTDQAAVAQAIGQTGVTVANRVVKKEDPTGAFTDPNYGKNIRPIDTNTWRQIPDTGAAPTNPRPAFPNNGVTPQTGFDAIDRALNGGKGVTPKLDPAIAPENKKNLDGALPGNSNRDKLSDPSKNGTAQVNAMREQLAKAESQPMGQTGNNIDAINAAFKKIGTPTQGNLDEMAKLNQERPVNIFVPKPNSPTIPGGISDATMNKIKGTAPEYKAPDGVNQALSRAIEQGTAMADSGEPGKAQVGAGLLTGAGVIQGIYNIPGNTKAAAGALAKDPGSVTSEDVGQAVQRFAIDGILGIPVGLGQFGAIATGTKVADVQRRAAESMEELSGGELTENARNLSTVAGAAAMALPIGKGTLGVAKAGAAKLGGLFEGGAAGQVGKTPNFVSASLGRTVLNAEAKTYVGKGPGPENIGSSGMGGALRDLTDTLRNQSAKGADVAVVKNFENWFGSGSPKPQEGYIRTSAERTTMADGSAASPLFERFVATEGGQPYAAVSLTDATISPSHFVADAKGAPRRAYHGSGAQFDAFAKADPDGMLGKGYYFTSEKPVATNYANRAVEAAPNTGAQPVVYDVALSLKKPYVITTPQLNVLWNSGKGAKAEIVDSIKNQGFDGLVYENKLGEKTYMIFDPTQIKSLQNNGQFDPKNPNMHSSLLQSPVGSLA
jgi:hypothetical protein